MNTSITAPDLFSEVDARLDASRLWADVAAAIATLPQGERDTLLLFAWEGMPYDQIAAALDVPVGTVRSRLNRARGRLRELVGENEEELVTATLRPDRVYPVDEGDPGLFKREKERLMSTIGTRHLKPKHGAAHPAMYPRLVYADEVAALEYLTRVFQFTERREARMGGDDDEGMLAWLEFGDGVVMIGRATAAARDVHHLYSPGDVGHATVMINVAVNGIDSHYEHAVAEGATITMPIEDAFYGFRRYEADDLEGHHWHFHEPLEAIRAGKRLAEAERVGFEPTDPATGRRFQDRCLRPLGHRSLQWPSRRAARRPPTGTDRGEVPSVPHDEHRTAVILVRTTSTT